MFIINVLNYVVVAVKQRDIISVLSQLLTSAYTKMNALITIMLLEDEDAVSDRACWPC